MKEKLSLTLEIIHSIITNPDFFRKFESEAIEELREVKRCLDYAIKRLNAKTESNMIDSDGEFIENYERKYSPFIKRMVKVLRVLEDMSYDRGINTAYLNRLSDCRRNLIEMEDNYFVIKTRNGFYLK